MAGIDANEFRSVMDELIAAVDQFRIAMTGGSAMAQAEADAYREDSQRNRESLKKNTKATDDNTKSKKFATVALDGLKKIAAATGKELLNVGREGISLAEKLGTSATKGVEFELEARAFLVKQIGSVATDLQVDMEQVRAAATGFANTFGGVRAGMEFSAEGAGQFASELKAGFGSEFKATPQTFRMLIDMGISNVRQMESFRKATGKAGLQGDYLASVYSKNTLSFMLYGESFARAAMRAESLGINLASVQAAQEGMVTNLDGTIDTVAQLNQLGAQLDFGTLIRIAEQEGPEALLSYVRQVVPEQLMQSTSTRALFKQLGISVEDYIREGSKQTQTAAVLENRFSRLDDGVSKTAETLTTLARTDTILNDAFGETYNAAKDAAAALFGLAAQAAGSALINLLRGGLPGGTPPMPGPQPASLLNRIGSKIPIGGPAGMATSLGAASTTAIAGTVLTGAAIGLTIGDQFNTSVAEGGEGNLGNWWYQMTGLKKDEAEANELQRQILDLMRRRDPTLQPEIDRLTKQRQDIEARITRMGDDVLSMGQPVTPRMADDAVSPGYGRRMLVTPTEIIALNNADDVVAGTNLFPKGSLSMGGMNNFAADRLMGETSNLLRKVERLIDTLNNANTTVNIENKIETVPRLQLVGVYSRNEMR